MLKLPTSLFECICFICVNIVSFISLWGFCSPGLFITVFSQPNLEQTNIQNVPEKSNEDCVSTLMYFLYFLSSLFSVWWIVLFQSFISAYIQHCGSGQRSNAPFGAGPQTHESLNCAFGLPYIKINSLCSHRKRPWSQKRASFICISHTFGHVSGPAGEPGLYLVCPFLPNWGILHAVLEPESTFIDRGGHFDMYINVCRPFRHRSSPA